MEAFGISEEDVENVLRRHVARLRLVTAPPGALDYTTVAEKLFGAIDQSAVERAALKGGVELEEQTDAAYDEIERQLVHQGVLEQRRSEPAAPADRHIDKRGARS